MKTIAISLGDINGVGLEIALNSHKTIKKLCNPLYMINKKLLQRGAKLLKKRIPDDFKVVEVGEDFEITPGEVSKKSGLFSYQSFLKAVELAKAKKVDAITTLPINKEAWNKAGIKEAGHTYLLDKIFNKKAIMMIGCEKLFTILYTHHIPLKKVPKKIKTKKLLSFLLDSHNSLKVEKIGVLALNPHAGDGGVLGDEEKKINKAIKKANKILEKEVFVGPLVPDTAFTPFMRKDIQHFVCMYHDQGLIATKSLYFEESINVSLNLPIIRTSVDHGTAYDIAYKDKNPSNLSYINAIKEAVRLASK